ncbi:MAG: ABC transporter ATP-binding protein [Thermoleophilia bacterium]|nr:ABC transporter ATP-binding protein [Thermoleophilia bacterium]
MIELRNVTKKYGTVTAVDDVSLTIPDGELTIVLGPSGCGKTTVLRTINRMVEIDSGEVIVDGRPIDAVPPEELRRHIGYAIQSVGLFPHMTVRRNIATVPRLLGWERARVSERVNELLDLVGLDPAIYADKRPGELSGGEAQRVGVARALAADPPVLLMDEPFGALDPISRERLQREFAALHKRLGKTVVFVTHDIEEAVLLGDRIVLMRDGRIVQVGAPEELWRSPEGRFVRDFFGDEFGLRILSRHRVADLTLGPPPPDKAPQVRLETNLRDVLAIMVTESVDRVAVVSEERAIGSLTFCEVVTQVRETT